MYKIVRLVTLLLAVFFVSIQYSFSQKIDSCRWKAVAGGTNYTVGIRIDGTLWYWKYGANVLNASPATKEKPQLISSDRDWISLSGGIWHFFALKKDGTLWVLGRNWNGAFGDGTFSNRTTLTQVGTSNDWRMISTNFNHTLAIKKNGTLWAWGSNSNYQLGNNVPNANNYPTPIQIGSDVDWSYICAGSSSSFAIKLNGTLWAWGFNNYGHIGDGTLITKTTPTQIGVSVWRKISSCGNTTLGIKSDGTLWAWGRNSIGQYGNNTTVNTYSPIQVGSLNTWIDIVLYDDHAIALKSDNTLWTWGKNTDGQLGDGSIVSKKSPVQIASNVKWQFISMAQYHSTAIDINGKLWVWGNYAWSVVPGGSSLCLIPRIIDCKE